MCEAGSLFVTRLWHGAVDTMKQHCSGMYTSRTASTGPSLHSGCQRKLQALQEELKPSTEHFDAAGKKQWLQSFAQVVMDCTYNAETKLVNDDFEGPADCQIMQDIWNDLGLILTVSGAIDKNPVVTLGEEMTECIHWRQGALYYMFCATIYPDIHGRKSKQLEQFKTFAENGILCLDAMLNTRKPLTGSIDEFTVNSEEMFNMLKRGIFSDVHVLALMYSGELCDWLLTLKISEETQASTIHKKYKDMCQKNLKLYLELVNGPLKGWDGTKAKQILSKMQNL